MSLLTDVARAPVFTQVRTNAAMFQSAQLVTIMNSIEELGIDVAQQLSDILAASDELTDDSTYDALDTEYTDITNSDVAARMNSAFTKILEQDPVIYYENHACRLDLTAAGGTRAFDLVSVDVNDDVSIPMYTYYSPDRGCIAPLNLIQSVFQSTLDNAKVAEVSKIALDLAADGSFSVSEAYARLGCQATNAPADIRQLVNCISAACCHLPGVPQLSVIPSVIQSVFSHSQDSMTVNAVSGDFSFTAKDDFAIRSAITIPFKAIVTTVSQVAATILTFVNPIVGAAANLAFQGFTTGFKWLKNTFSPEATYDTDAACFADAYPAIQLEGVSLYQLFGTNPQVSDSLPVETAGNYLATGVLGSTSFILETPTCYALVWNSSGIAASRTNFNDSLWNVEVHLIPTLGTHWRYALDSINYATTDEVNPKSRTYTVLNGGSDGVVKPLRLDFGGWGSRATNSTDDEVVRYGMFNSLVWAYTCIASGSVAPGITASLQGIIPTTGALVAVDAYSDSQWASLSQSQKTSLSMAFLNVLSNEYLYGTSISLPIPSWLAIQRCLDGLNFSSGLSTLFNGLFGYNGAVTCCSASQSTRDSITCTMQIPAGISFAIIHPKYSPKALITAALMSIGTAALVATTAVLVGKIKRRVSYERSIRYAKVQSSFQTLQNNPTVDNAKAYRKAVKSNNRFAKFFGGSSCGFVDGYLQTNDASLSGGSSDLINSLGAMLSDIRGTSEGGPIPASVSDIMHALVG